MTYTVHYDILVRVQMSVDNNTIILIETVIFCHTLYRPVIIIIYHDTELPKVHTVHSLL